MVLARRALGSADWEIRKTRYKGNTRDAHNTISIIVDSTGVLHMSWDHHCNPLNYCRSKKHGSLELTDPMPMTGRKENKVTYPEFYNLPGGGLLFEATELIIDASGPAISCRGGNDQTDNGGTLKLFYGTLSGAAPTSDYYGRLHDAGPGSYP